MRIRKFKKIAAAAMAAVLAITAIPAMGLANANAADTDVTKTVNFDLSGVEAVKETTTDFVVGDVPVIAGGGKMSVVDIAEGAWVTNENGVVYKKHLNSGGSGNTGKRAMKLVLPTTSNVTVWALSNSDKEKRDWVIADATGDLHQYSAAELGTSVTGVTTTLKAGTYFIYTKASVNFYDIDIQWTMDFDLGEAGEIEAETVKGDFTLIAGTAADSKNLTVDVPEGVTDESGVAFTQRLKLNGSGSKSKRAVKFVLPHTATLNIYALSGGDAERTLKVENAETGTTVDVAAAGKATTTVQPQAVTLAAGTYYIYSGGSGINILDIRAKYDMSFDLGEAGEIEAETTKGDFTFIAGTAADSKNLTVDVPEGVTDDAGVAFTQRLKLNGSGSKSKRAVKFTLDYRTKLDIYALSGGDAARTLKVENAETGATVDVEAAGKATTTVQPKTVTLAPGTYYIYSGGSGINILDIRRTPDKQVCDWSEVETPVINSVTVNEKNGNFVVDFTGKVDKYEGAEYIMISMVSNGAEVSSKKVTGKETSIEMTPYWDGDYSFTITAMRSGAAHKVGNTFDVKDFKLRLKAPVFRMFESIGGGKVYVDWVDNEFADVYEVYYKLATDTDDKYVAVTTEYTEGNIVLADLTVGNTYTIKVVAKNTESGFSSAYADDVTVTEKAADKQWNVATTGSNQTVNMTITTADGAVETHVLSVQDQSTDKTSHKEVTNVTNTTGKVEIAAAADGKISDDEDGFRYYYTMVNPNTENFKITATFKITDVSLTPDNQTGFGIMAADILGVNWFGDGTYVHKYHNSLLMGHYSATGNSTAVLKYVTGYNSGDASNADTAERVNNSKKFSGAVAYQVGNTYTFTLEKTNEKFIGTFNGQSIELDDTSILSVQEDGSICVGVFSARKVGVEITDIKFETSESTGVTGTVKTDKIAPSTRIYSTNTSGSTDYELIYASNVPGLLTVTGPDGKVYDSVTMKADSVARVNVAIATGSNTIKTVFIPSKDASLTSYADIENSITVTCKQIGKEDGAIYVSPTGTTDGEGTKESPMSLAEVVKYARPGQVIVMMDGEYTKSISIPRSVTGTADKMITLMAENTGKAVFTGGAGLSIEGAYWHVYGINTVGASGVGIQIYGNYNVVEMCVVQGSKNSGIQISRSGSASNAQGIEGLLWPSYNLVKNCESFDNCDAGMNDADGFAAKLTCGEGNKFYGCSSHNNIDDGWDLFAKTVSGEIGSVTIENCIAYDNGVLSDGSKVTAGEGNGFKLGGGYLNGGHVLKNSIAFNNIGKGITSNSCPDVEIYNCISYNNQATGGKGYNVGLNAKAAAEKPWKVEGLISMNVPDNTTTADLISFALQSKTNFIYDGAVSFNTDGVIAEDSWFVSTDVSKKPTRNEDGTINMAGLLELTAETQAALPGVGAVLVVAGDEAVSVAPTIPTDNGDDSTPGDDGDDTPGAGDDGDDTPGAGDGAGTGDSNNALPFAIAMLASVVLLAGVAFYGKKRRIFE